MQANTQIINNDSVKKFHKKVYIILLFFFILLIALAFLFTRTEYYAMTVTPRILEYKLKKIPLPNEVEVLKVASGYDSCNLGATRYPWSAMLIKSENQIRDLDFSILGERKNGKIFSVSDYYSPNKISYNEIIGEKLGIGEKSGNQNCYIVLIEDLSVGTVGGNFMID